MQSGFFSYLSLAILLAMPALAQEMPVYEETGTIEISFGNEGMTYYTTSNTVSADPGRQVHTASWLILEPRLMGGVNISPDDVFVVIQARDSIEPRAGQATIRVEVSLDPDTLQLKKKPAPSIRFFPKGEDDFYAMTDGTFEIDSVTRIDANNFSIVASARGVMTGQTGEPVVHNPDDPVDFSARFELQRVSNRGDVSLP